jgi:L-fuconolactonase
MRELARFPNVLCKLSGMVTEADWRNWKPEHMAPYLDIALSCFGAERVMIGSDWPVCTVAASYAQTMNLVLDYLGKYPADVQDAILGGSARRFWKLTL